MVAEALHICMQLSFIYSSFHGCNTFNIQEEGREGDILITSVSAKPG